MILVYLFQIIINLAILVKLIKYNDKCECYNKIIKNIVKFTSVLSILILFFNIYIDTLETRKPNLKLLHINNILQIIPLLNIPMILLLYFTQDFKKKCACNVDNLIGLQLIVIFIPALILLFSMKITGDYI